MDNEKEIWDNATNAGNYVKFEENKSKTLKLTNWSLGVNERLDNKVAFEAQVLLEDGVAPVQGKEARLLSTTSKRLLKKLRFFFEGKPKTHEVTLRISKVGAGFETQYSVEEVK